MSDQDKIAPDQESEKTDSQPASSEETVGEVLKANDQAPESPKDTVPLSALLEMKKANKELSRELKDLKKTINDGASKHDVSSSIEELAEKFPDVDPDFLREFAAAVRTETKKETDEEITAKLKPIQEKERAEKIDQAFKTHFDKAMELVPEYSGIVNQSVIKSLSLLPENANKTFTQLIEESYGHLVTGKRSMDAASSRVSKNDSGDVDVARAQKDQEYFKEVMASPSLKQKYNDSLVSRIASQL
jgi:DNA polymerase I-like protein with 3'-5' exonuclease and polymerase domains